jgi:hypothetical protein
MYHTCFAVDDLVCVDLQPNNFETAFMSALGASSIHRIHVVLNLIVLHLVIAQVFLDSFFR